MTGKGLDKDSFILLTVQEVDYEGEKKILTRINVL